MEISDQKAESPESACGMIARSYLYMHKSYKKYSMSRQQLMNVWHKPVPVTQWECLSGQ